MRYQAPRGQRIKTYGYIGICVHYPGVFPWWDDTEKRWVQLGQSNGQVSNMAPCRSVRAFRKHLKKHPHMRGKIQLVSRFYNHDIFG